MNKINNIIETSLNNLQKYIEYNEDEQFSVYKYLREINPTLIVDLDSFKSYLLDDDISEKDKCAFIISLYKTIEDIRLNRKHEKESSLSVFECFCDKNPNIKIDEITFKKLYNSINGLKIKANEIKCIDKAYRLVECLNKLTTNQEEKLEFLAYAITNTITPLQMLDFFECDIDKELKKEFYLCLRNNKLKICCDAAILLTTSEINDFEIENKCIYYQITSSIIKKGDFISLFYNANPFFINKLANDELMRNKKLCFILDNQYLVDIFKALYKNISFEFIYYDNLYTFLISNDCIINNCSIFVNRVFQDEEVLKLISSINKYFNFDANIFIFGQDERIDSDTRSIKTFLLSKDYSPKNIFLFPSEIKNATTPQRKLLLSLKANKLIFNDGDVAIYSYNLDNSSNNQFLRLRPFVLNINKDDYSTNKCRTIYSKNYYDSKSLTNDRRQSSHSFNFSKEIKVYYTISPIKNSSNNTINFYLKHPYRIDEINNEFIIETGYKFDKSKIQITNLNVEDIEDFINNEYFYKKKRSNENFESIRNDVAKDYLLVYSQHSITLKTLVLFYEEFENNLDEDDKALLYEIINEELGWIKTDSITSEIINNYLNNKYYLENDELQKQDAKKLISKLLDFAIEKEHAIDNPIKKEVKYINYDRRGIIDVRNARSKASIDLNLVRKLVKSELNKTNSNNSFLATALLLKIFTPLTFKEICSLKFNDLFKSEHFMFNNKSFYYLKIRRSMDKNYHYVQFDNIKQYRSIPIPNVLAEILLKQKQNLIDTNPSLGIDVINDNPIIEGDMVTSDYLHNVLDPSKLSDYCKKMLKKLGIKSDFVTLHKKSGVEEIDLTFTKSDLLRNNYRYYAIFKGYLTEDELEFLCGNKATTVFSNNYCDYNNETSLYQLYIKQERIASSFLYDEKKLDKISFYKGDKLSFTQERATNPSYLNIIIRPKNNKEFNLIIDNEYGFSFSKANLIINKEDNDDGTI